MAVVLIALYIMSPGPVVLVVRKSQFKPGPVIETFFAPLEYAYRKYPWVNSFYNAYFQAIGAKQ